MSKRKPCGRPIKGGGECTYTRMSGKQRCAWHWLAGQSSDVQADHARVRLRLAEGEHLARVKAADCPPGERWCAGCQSFVPLFYTTGSRCKACSSMASHERRLEQVYGIDGAEYERIFRVQGGRCAICRNRPASIRFAVDHDHESGQVRGILCKRCNHDLLGGAHDDIELLYRALEYLLFPPAEHARPIERHLVLAALNRRLALREILRAETAFTTEPPPF